MLKFSEIRRNWNGGAVAGAFAYFFGGLLLVALMVGVVGLSLVSAAFGVEGWGRL